jgi:serine/threonine protein kinase
VAKVRLLDPTDSKRRLDRYDLIGELASGGMATVFLGRLGGVGGFQRFVAIKRLHPHLANEEEFIEMFLDEARLAAGIHHPHVVPILEVGQSENGYYLVMEYIEGDTLMRLMGRSFAMAKPIPRPVLVRIVLDTLAGLHAAHELNDANGQPVQLVHRDVSPQNILVGVDGCSRITDFGVAHAASRLSNTRADRLKGKLAYMSPEQARCGEVDRRSDVFAMGIILWEVLAAKRLFKAEHEAMTLQKVTIEPIPRLSSVVSGVHPALDQVCARALDRDPSRRYRSAAEMAEALERAARTAASASPTDLGVASPREVAAYVQGALGEDIAAQRESVRAWLAHSEPSLPRVVGVSPAEMLGRKPVLHDITVKVPLDRPAPAPEPGEVTVTTGSRAAVTNEVASQELLSDDDDDHETLLMDRDAANSAMAALGLLPSSAPATPAPPPSLPRRGPFGEDGTQSTSVEALELIAASSAPRPNRTPQVVAVVVGILIALCLVIWSQLASGPALPPPTPGATPGATPATTTATATKPAETAAPTSKPAPTATPVTEVTTATAAPPPVVKGPMPGARPPKGKASATPSAAPVTPPPTPEPAKPPEDKDAVNPYR